MDVDQDSMTGKETGRLGYDALHGRSIRTAHSYTCNHRSTHNYLNRYIINTFQFNQPFIPFGKTPRFNWFIRPNMLF
jgi:hypothetical protein